MYGFNIKNYALIFVHDLSDLKVVISIDLIAFQTRQR